MSQTDFCAVGVCGGVVIPIKLLKRKRERGRREKESCIANRKKSFASTKQRIDFIIR